MADQDGPLLVEGPVEVVLADGSVVASERFTVAVCTCRRSLKYPWCDTSHRRRERAARPAPDPGTAPDGAGSEGAGSESGGRLP
ncbi:CDGSH iron-sulfur domain-containing protein [Streptomyces sp. TP-A0874]|uniref:CDGSH iron-sulfur domain-containing protein n=1 Tax=Streptomyces sp. TP-A0874 TaxID=549819 RepID=UPI000B1A1996